MSRLPIRARLTAVFALAMVIVLAGAALFVYARLKADLDESIDDTLRARSAVGKTVNIVDPEDEFAEWFRGDDGSVVLTRAEARRARRGHVFVERDDVVNREGTTFRIYARGDGDGVVAVGLALDDRDETLDGLLASFLIGGMVAVLLASLLGYALATSALRPVEAMRRRAAAVSLDGETERLPLPAAHDEIRRLGETLNAMLDRLRASFDRERQFVADASHELRTPIAVIKTELEAALRTGDHAPLGVAIEECDGLAQLADDLLILAREDLPVHPEPLDARAVLTAARDRFADRAARAGRAIDVDAPEGVVLRADPLRLRQALTNLVDNALRHGAGTVTLSARAATVAVADEGEGFAADFAPHAFDRFTRGDAARTARGAGLGLAIVRTIAEAHGGTVEIEGATVRIRLSG